MAVVLLHEERPTSSHKHFKRKCTDFQQTSRSTETFELRPILLSKGSLLFALVYFFH